MVISVYDLLGFIQWPILKIVNIETVSAGNMGIVDDNELICFSFFFNAQRWILNPDGNTSRNEQEEPSIIGRATTPSLLWSFSKLKLEPGRLKLRQ